MSHPWGIGLPHLRSSGPFVGETRDCSEGRDYVTARGHGLHTGQEKATWGLA